MSESDQKIIELSRKKVLLLILGSCIFVILGTWMIFLDEAEVQAQSRLQNSTFVHGVGLVSVVFFGFCGVVGVRKLLDKKPGLVLNSAGVIDNSSGVAAGLIPWSEVVGVEVFEIHKQKMLILKVVNPQKYIECGGWLKQMLNKANFKICGSPIVIPSNALQINFSELFSAVTEYRRKYGNT